ncbi:hypothetical protein JB92DRAFT_2924944 [Gautieria morchelliformis]|nr:hypothetical protein JB92DRAFT_2924944 [Gautieria morchelliformis]
MAVYIIWRSYTRLQELCCLVSLVLRASPQRSVVCSTPAAKEAKYKGCRQPVLYQYGAWLLVESTRGFYLNARRRVSQSPWLHIVWQWRLATAGNHTSSHVGKICTAFQRRAWLP